jgi:hypothetical protein
MVVFIFLVLQKLNLLVETKAAKQHAVTFGKPQKIRRWGARDQQRPPAQQMQATL